MKKILCSLFVISIVFSFIVVNPISHNIDIVEAKSKIKLNINKKIITKGLKFNLKITGTNKKVIWKTSNKTIATVNSKGTVVTKKKGKCIITATVSGKSYKCNVIVETPSISIKNKTLLVGKSMTLKMNGTTRKPVWSSSNVKIASVNSKGVVKSIKAGSATITAKIDNKKYVCKIVVKSASTQNKYSGKTITSIVNLNEQVSDDAMCVIKELITNKKATVTSNNYDTWNKTIGKEVVQYCYESGATYNYIFINNIITSNKQVVLLKSSDNIGEIYTYYNQVYKAVYDAGIRKGMTEEEAIYRISTYIAKKAKYDNNYEYATDILNYGLGKCTSYADLTQDMARTCGISCQLVENGDHAWNYININNKNYFIDVTWMDNKDGTVNTKYYLTKTIWSDQLHKNYKIVDSFVSSTTLKQYQ